MHTKPQSNLSPKDGINHKKVEENQLSTKTSENLGKLNYQTTYPSKLNIPPELEKKLVQVIFKNTQEGTISWPIGVLNLKDEDGNKYDEIHGFLKIVPANKFQKTKAVKQFIDDMNLDKEEQKEIRGSEETYFPFIKNDVYIPITEIVSILVK